MGMMIKTMNPNGNMDRTVIWVAEYARASEFSHVPARALADWESGREDT